MVDKIGEGEQVRLAPLHDRPQKPLYEDGQPGCKRIEQQPKPPCPSAKIISQSGQQRCAAVDSKHKYP